MIRADNGPELRGRVLEQWAYEHGVWLQFIEPGKPIQNAHIESFNACLREECLNEHVFVSLDELKDSWPPRCNARRPRIQNLTVIRVTLRTRVTRITAL